MVADRLPSCGLICEFKYIANIQNLCSCILEILHSCILAYDAPPPRMAVQPVPVHDHASKHPVRLLVLARLIQSANSVFLSQKISTSQLKSAQIPTSENLNLVPNTKVGSNNFKKIEQ